MIRIWAPSRWATLALLLACAGAASPGCDDAGDDPQTTDPADAETDGDVLDATEPDALVYSEDREACADRSPLRNPYFGDLHVHTQLSFDAWVEGTRAGPADAYRFARGAELGIAPLDANGDPTQTVRLDRPLDFAAVTDHAEYFGEVAECVTPGSAAYDLPRCIDYRDSDAQSISGFATQLTNEMPTRLDICDTADCAATAASVWDEVRMAAEDAYDRSAACEFTTFVGYEWTGNTAGRNLHRNVIFRNADVPDRALSYIDAPTPQLLWDGLEQECNTGDGECEALAIPHNSNLSNGGMFQPSYPNGASVAEQAAAAAFRRRLEPIVEVVQHKGASECNNGFAGVLGAPDELCAVEAVRQSPFDDCGDDLGALGIRASGCVSRYDYARTTLLEGLVEARRIGENPYRFGMIGSTDTHNATPGYVREDSWLGHTGAAEGTLEGRFTREHLAPFGIVANPGGLAGVWALENSRDAIFDALVRREAWATSGTRIVPRFFGSREFPDDLCESATLVESGYADGVPMGGTLPDGEGAPVFVAHAMRDASDAASPLERLQIVKGSLTADGTPSYEVFDVAGAPAAEPNLDTCDAPDAGSPTLCTVWRDPAFDPAVPAFYYLRVVETPVCRWSWRECLTLAEADRPATCSDPTVPRTIREMAWTSPIWFEPPQ